MFTAEFKCSTGQFILGLFILRVELCLISSTATLVSKENIRPVLEMWKLSL